VTDDRTTEFDAIRAGAAAAAQAWVVATGLAAGVTDFRRRHDLEAGPVPGLTELVDRVTDDFTDLSALLDVALAAAEAPADDDPGAGARRLERARILHTRIGATTRRIAQAVLGATSLGAGTDDTLRLELAASVACTEPEHVPLAADGPIELFAVTPDDLVLEVAGIVARLLLDWGGGVALRTADGAGVDLEVVGDTVVVTPHGLPPGPGVGSWPSPVVIGDLAREVVADLVVGTGIETALELEAHVPGVDPAALADHLADLGHFFDPSRCSVLPGSDAPIADRITDLPTDLPADLHADPEGATRA